jgi:Transposase DDE domain
MTILITFHRQYYRNFKHYYIDHVSVYWAAAFPGLPSYQRFVEWIPDTLLPLCIYLKQCFGACTGISFIDSTCLKVCHNRLNDKLLSRKRSIIETIIDQLKNISQIEHARHRSPINFCTNVLCGLIAYCHQPKKPSIGFEWVLPSAA